ncbi:MAG: hypothetical protein ACRD0K_02510 [Egibacteraceae bacterium]
MIVANSLGIYILDNALPRDPYLRFANVLLRGSIPPRDFPWGYAARPQPDPFVTQETRHETCGLGWSNGSSWHRRVRVSGFTQMHVRLIQERHDLSRPEHFERGHMEDRWPTVTDQHLCGLTA